MGEKFTWDIVAQPEERYATVDISSNEPLLDLSASSARRLKLAGLQDPKISFYSACCALSFQSRNKCRRWCQMYTRRTSIFQYTTRSIRCSFYSEKESRTTERQSSFILLYSGTETEVSCCLLGEKWCSRKTKNIIYFFCVVKMTTNRIYCQSHGKVSI